MLKVKNNLIAARGLPLVVDCRSPLIAIDVSTCIEALIAQEVQNPSLPANPPFEVHPYGYQLHDCEKYIIGTFPPISYLLDDERIIAANITSLRQPPGAGGRKISKPEISFYHGNKGSMWDYLLTEAEFQELFGNPRNHRRQWLVDKLYTLEINYCDTIYSSQRCLNYKGRYDAKDINLNNICINNNLVSHILRNPEAKSILFNTASIFGEKGIQLSDGVVDVSNDVKSFDVFVRACQNLGLRVEIQIQQGAPGNRFGWKNISELSIDQRRKKIAFEMRISNFSTNAFDGLNVGENKVLSLFTGPSPSTIAELGLNGNAICDHWLRLNDNSSRSDFIRFVYQSFRNSDYQEIYELNQN